jgi:hypothetical protein
MKSIIRLSHADLNEVKRCLALDQKIKAVKHCRNHGHHYIDGIEQCAPGLTKMSLRAAKHAVEHLAGNGTRNPEAVIAPPLRIKKIIVETMEGEMELDVDLLQLKLLEGLSTIPLSVMSSSTELIQYIRNWQDPK